MKPEGYSAPENLTNQILSSAANNLIKKIREKEAGNPVMFADRIGFSPDPWQRKVLISERTKLILNCSRQSGKSTTTAVLSSHKAIHKDNSLILIVCPSERQSGELLRKVKGVLAKTPDVDFDRNSVLTVEISNGSRILALPSSEANIRTFSAVDLLILDEASRIADEVFYAVRPMLAVSGGQQILLSTPNGKRGFFYETWMNGSPDEWQKIEITAADCPRISPEFLASEKASMPESLYYQEYFCQFRETTDSVFSYDDIQAALDPTLKPLFETEDSEFFETGEFEYAI